MTVTDVQKDATLLTLSIATRLDAPIDPVWELWSDPRQLERWWGPPTYPATFVEHNLVPGGLVTYFMTGPDGDQPRGWWRVRAVDAPRRLEFEGGFADESWNPKPDEPTMRMVATLDVRAEGGTTMTITTTFPSIAVMEQVLTMGMAEGMSAALGQIDALLPA